MSVETFLNFIGEKKCVTDNSWKKIKSLKIFEDSYNIRYSPSLLQKMSTQYQTPEYRLSTDNKCDRNEYFIDNEQDYLSIQDKFQKVFQNVFKNNKYPVFQADKNINISNVVEVKKFSKLYGEIQEEVVCYYYIDYFIKLGKQFAIHLYIGVLESDTTPSVIINALILFFKIFPKYQNGSLYFYISLDRILRIIPDAIHHTFQEKIMGDIIKERFVLLWKESAALLTSAYTLFDTICITKKQEVIKTLFHELIHWIRAENFSRDIKTIFNFYNMSVVTKLPESTKTSDSEGLDEYAKIMRYVNFSPSSMKRMINPSEVYAEFLSVMMNSIYFSIILKKKYQYRDPLSSIFYQVINLEIKNSIYLSVKLLEFYGYNRDNYIYFFKGSGLKIYGFMPDAEYILYRTILLLQYPEVCRILEEDVTNQYIITEKNENKILALLEKTELLKDTMEPYFGHNDYQYSYVLFDPID